MALTPRVKAKLMPEGVNRPFVCRSFHLLNTVSKLEDVGHAGPAYLVCMTAYATGNLWG